MDIAVPVNAERFTSLKKERKPQESFEGILRVLVKTGITLAEVLNVKYSYKMTPRDVSFQAQ